METYFYAKTLKKDQGVWSEEFSKYLCRFAKSFDFSVIDIRWENAFVYVFKNEMLKHIWKGYTEEDLKQLEFLSRRNPDDLKPKDFKFISDKIFEESIRIHVGNRINAGYWCNNCNITMSTLGHAKIHSSDTTQNEICPYCGATPNKGLIKTTSFTFQFDKEFWSSIMKKLPDTKIYDQYNTKVDVNEFMTFTYSKVVYSKFYKYLG